MKMKWYEFNTDDAIGLLWILWDIAIAISLAFVFPLWRNILIGIAVVIAILLVIRLYWKRKRK